jgi:hypothetical protein
MGLERMSTEKTAAQIAAIVEYETHEPAFARSGTVLPNGRVEGGSLGLTKRELFAAMIMQGLAGNSIPGSHHTPDQQAADAVQKADALLLELAK